MTCGIAQCVHSSVQFNQFTVDDHSILATNMTVAGASIYNLNLFCTSLIDGWVMLLQSFPNSELHDGDIYLRRLY